MVRQHPGYGSTGSIDQTQAGTNDNTTNQSADASALTKQLNVNAPISILSWGSNGGGDSYGCGCDKGRAGVDQNNHAYTSTFADNSNGTRQNVDQDQDATIVAPAKPASRSASTSREAAAQRPQAVRMRLPEAAEAQPPAVRMRLPEAAEAQPPAVRMRLRAAETQPQPCGRDYPKPPKEAPGSGSIDQTQTGSNDNTTDQRCRCPRPRRSRPTSTRRSACCRGVRTTVTSTRRTTPRRSPVRATPTAPISRWTRVRRPASSSGPAYRPRSPSWKPTA